MVFNVLNRFFEINILNPQFIFYLLQLEADNIYLRHLLASTFKIDSLSSTDKNTEQTKLSNLRHFHFLLKNSWISQKPPPLPFNSAQKFLPSPLLLHLDSPVLRLQTMSPAPASERFLLS